MGMQKLLNENDYHIYEPWRKDTMPEIQISAMFWFIERCPNIKLNEIIADT